MYDPMRRTYEDMAALKYKVELNESEDFEELAVTVDDAARAGALPGFVKEGLRSALDPFDRMLIAQALSRNLVLISNESLFDRYGVRRLW